MKLPTWLTARSQRAGTGILGLFYVFLEIERMKKIYIFINNFSAAFAKKNISDFAASAAFFLFLSLIPMMMLMFALLPYTGVTEMQLLDWVLRVTPDSMDQFFASIINEIYIMSSGIITISIIVTIWSAGKGMQSLIRGLNSINDIEEYRGFFILRGLGCLYTIVLMVVSMLMMALMMFGKSLYKIIVYHIPELAKMKTLILYARYPLSLVVLVVLFTLIYCFVPSLKQKFNKQLPGALFSAVVLVLASFAFSVYLQFSDDFSTYGSMAMVIIVMMYMYMMMYIILIGAYINQWLGRSISN